MKNKTIIFVLVSFLSLSFAASSHAITITGSETITTNSNTTYTTTGCNGTVSWSVTGVGSSISSNGVLTAGLASCGGITVTARCSDGSIATKTIRVSNAGKWGNQIYTFNCSWGGSGASLQWCDFISGNTWTRKLYESASVEQNCTPCQPCADCPLSTPECFSGECMYHVETWTAEWKCLPCTNGQSIPCYTGPAGTENIGAECKAGTQTCVNGQWGACMGEVLPQAEICGDSKDNNCDGNVDEGCETCEVSVKVSPLMVWPQKTGGKTEADVIVTLSKPAPSGGCNINFNIEPVSYSGKHSHHNSDRPKGEITPNSISFSQGEIGAQSARYKSSEVAGEEKIKAKVNDKDTSETIIQVKVPGFFELGAGDGYVLIGQTNTHPENHYGTENALSSLLDIAGAYLEKEKGTLRINDISLEWGGLFDIGPPPSTRQFWNPPHNTHRVGKNVDVDDVTAEGKKVTKIQLDKLIKEEGLNITVLDEKNHLHLTFP